MDDFLEQLKNLEKDNSPQWGRMTAQHMIEHLILSVQMGNGKLEVECNSREEKLPVLKKFLLSDRPMPKGYNNPALGKLLQPLHYSSLEEALQQLIVEVRDYNLYFQNTPEAKPVNITFGKLTKDEWDKFHSKHFTHHLSQFGLM